MIKHVVFDFDGVFTDNFVYINEKGEEMVRCSRADGLGLAKLKELGINTFILSTETNKVVAKRAKKLGIKCFHSIEDKLKHLKLLIPENELKNTVFVGNDTNDLEVMQAVGYPVAVADAYYELLNIAKYVTNVKGGHGAVREVCDLIYKKGGEL